MIHDQGRLFGGVQVALFVEIDVDVWRSLDATVACTVGSEARVEGSASRRGAWDRRVTNALAESEGR